MGERLHRRCELLMWKFCKRFNNFCVILSQVEIRYADAMGETTGIVPSHSLPHTPSTVYPEMQFS